MAAFLSELPRVYSDSAKLIIQQHLRRNTSGKFVSISLAIFKVDYEIKEPICISWLIINLIGGDGFLKL